MAQVAWMIVFFSSALILTSAAPSEEIVKCTTENTDNSESAEQAADEISKFIDKSVDPCDDFYHFACGGYIKNNEIPSDGVEISQFINVNNRVLEQLHVLMKEPMDDHEPRWSKLTKQFFHTCSNTDAINKHGLKTVKDIIKELGGWPVLEGEKWKGDDFDWQKLIYKCRELGLSTNQFLMTKVDPSAKNSSSRLIAIAQIDTIIERISLGKGFDDKRVQAYYQYMVDFASAFGANKDTALSDMKALINFMKDLSDITLPPEDLRDLSATTNVMTVKELQIRFPYIDWIEFLNKVIGPNVKITENDVVDVGMPKYVTNLESLLNKTPKRVIANYAITVTVLSTASYLSKEVRELELELGKSLSGTSSLPPKWKECLGEVSENFKIATAALYARKYFTKEAKTNVAKLITTLHEKFIDMLQKVDWMDEKTKNEALEKARTIKEHIAFPNELLDDKILNDYYENLEATDDYLQFSLNIGKFSRNKMSENLFKLVDRSDWKEHSASHEVNAFYHLSENAIIIPAAILQGAVFGHGRPNYLNYAGIGFIAGHELTHGFDDKGKQISKIGELENWWTAETEKAYAEKAKCILDQFNNFKSEKLNAQVNGVVTLGENIADNGGFKLAYEAYERNVEEHGPEKCLPNLEYTPKQLFWIAMANVWCTKKRDEYLKLEMETSDHSPSMYRVYGVVANSKEFVKDFNCPSGAKMHSKKKCTFW